MAFNWTDVSSLTAAQRTALAYFESLYSNMAGAAKVLTTAPTYTLSQVKAARAALAEMQVRIDAANGGIKMSVEYYQAKAVADNDAANP